MAFLGPPGVGKTMLAVGLAIAACQAGFSIYFTTLDDMVRQLREAETTGRFAKKLQTYLKPSVLVPTAQVLRDELSRAVVSSAHVRRPDGAALLQAGPTDETLGYIAAIYRLAYACGYTPTKAVGEALGASRATAGRWVAKARERGFLGPATGTRAGEARTPEERTDDGHDQAS